MRSSATRSIIWLMTPRGFSGAVAAGPRRSGGEIFSNVNAGMVCPLVVELKHLLVFPCYPDAGREPHPWSTQREWNVFKHSLCQMRGDCVHIAEPFP